MLETLLASVLTRAVIHEQVCLQIETLLVHLLAWNVMLASHSSNTCIVGLPRPFEGALLGAFALVGRRC